MNAKRGVVLNSILPGLWCMLIGAILLSTCKQKDVFAIPAESRQMLILLTDSISAPKGVLYQFEREIAGGSWQKTGEIIPALLGPNGLAWGHGLHDFNETMMPVKKEGDGCNPAGVFTMSKVYGYTPPDSIRELSMPYEQITKFTECIDDVNSQFYNQIVNRNEVEIGDWNSSEKMRFAGIYYAQTVSIDHNIAPAISGAGSCIFLHNWKIEDEVSTGCTEVAPENLYDIIYWLDSSLIPIIVQLPKQWYAEVGKSWGLPSMETLE